MERENEINLNVLELVKTEEGIETLSLLTGLSIEETKKAAERIRRENGLTFQG